jgi:hypothetical protein
MIPIPGQRLALCFVTVAQLPVQFGMNGAWSQGAASLVPAFESEPDAAT